MLNLTFLATLVACFIFFLWHALLFAAIFVLAGAGRPLTLALISLSRRPPTEKDDASAGRVVPLSRH